MKKFLLFWTALFALGFAACKQNDYTRSTGLTDSERETLVQYEQVGVIHNQVLDTILADMWQDKILAFNESKEDKLLTKSSVKESKQDRLINVAYNAIERGLKNSLPEITDEIIEHVASKEKFAAHIKHPLTRANGGYFFDNEENNVLNSLTSSQKQYYDKLKEIIDKEYVIEELLVRISILEEEIIKNVSETEWDVLLCATSVARNSAKYWDEKLLIWNIVINSEISEYSKEISVEELNALGLIETKMPLVKGIYGTFLTYLSPGIHPYPHDPVAYIMVIEGEGGINIGSIEFCPPGFFFDPETCMCGFPKNNWSNLIDTDIDGCVNGAIGGAIIGAEAGGVGAIPGAIGGAAGGALITSTACGISIIIDWLF
jgi:hypothetical protein